MNRHTMVHSQNQQNETSQDKMKRACIQCATSRVRCTRAVPCARCDAKGLNCEYRISPTQNPAIQNEQSDVSQPSTHTRPNAADTDNRITEPLDLTVVLDATQQTLEPQDPTSLTSLTSHDEEVPMQIDEISHGPLTYETDSRQDFLPQPTSGINWLSPGQTILQEWGSQLAGITESQVFSPTFNMLEFPDPLQLISTSAEQDMGWEHPIQQFPSKMQPGFCGGSDNHHQNGDIESPEKFVDAHSTGTSGSMGSKYYVHGVASRASFQRRFRNSRAMGGALGDGHNMAFDSSISISNFHDPKSPVSSWLTTDMYAKVVLGIQGETQTQPQLPSLDSFRLCVHLYFERLHPNFPFINKTHFIAEEPHWILLLAVAGVGATYLLSPQGSQWKHSMMQALERILSDRLNHFHYHQRESDLMQSALDMQGTVDGLLPLIQAKILHMLCMLHNSIPYFTRRAVFERAELVQWCSFLDLVGASSAVSTPLTNDADILLWIQMQSRLRAGMMIWVSAITSISWMQFDESLVTRFNDIL